MKKISLFLLLLALLCVFAACAKDTTDDNTNTHVHVFGEWSETTAPTCSTEGTETRRCSCGEAETHQLPPTALHTFGDDDACTVCRIEMVYTDSLIYELNADGDAYTVTGVSENGLKELFIPSVHQGKPVTAIGDNAFFAQTSVLAIKIPDSVTSIGRFSFAGEHTAPMRFTTFMIGTNSQLKTIGEGAFQYCEDLALITLPAGVTTINDKAFAACTAFTTFTFPDSVTSLGSGILSGCTALTSFTLPKDITVLPDNMFTGCTALQTVVLPDSITTIGSSAFFDCTALTDITLPASLTEIAHLAFENCVSMETIQLPKKLTTVGDGAFFGCVLLAEITIPENVTLIGTGAFKNCNTLSSIVFEKTTNWWITEDIENVTEENVTIIPVAFLTDHLKTTECLVITFVDFYWARTVE